MYHRVFFEKFDFLDQHVPTNQLFWDLIDYCQLDAQSSSSKQILKQILEMLKQKYANSETSHSAKMKSLQVMNFLYLSLKVTHHEEFIARIVLLERLNYK
jgi:hypothetical protein